MAKGNNKTDATLSAPQPTGKATRMATRKRPSTSKSDPNAAKPNTTADPQVLSKEQSSRPKQLAANKGSKDDHTANKPRVEPTSRKRQAPANEQPSNTGTTSPPEPDSEQPPAKKPKMKTVKDSGIKSTPAPTASTKNSKGSTKKVQKAPAPSANSERPAKENIPPKPVTRASKPKKSNAVDRREQQLNAADNEALEQRIKELEAENASQRLAVERLERTAKRHRTTHPTSTTADAKTGQLIEEPEAARYLLQVKMGLKDDYKTYAKVQRTVRDLSRRTLDFNQSWKNQDPIVIGDLYRAAAEKEPFLRRFRQNWATGKLAQMYLRNSRSYNANIDIPESAVAVRRGKVTHKGALEAGLPPPDLSKKKKPTPRGSIPAGSKLGKSTKLTARKQDAENEIDLDDLDEDDLDEDLDEPLDEDLDEPLDEDLYEPLDDLNEDNGIAGEDGKQEGDEEDGMDDRDDVDHGAPSSDGCDDE